MGDGATGGMNGRGERKNVKNEKTKAHNGKLPRCTLVFSHFFIQPMNAFRATAPKNTTIINTNIQVNPVAMSAKSLRGSSLICRP